MSNITTIYLTVGNRHGMTQCKVPARSVLDGAANTASMPDLLHHDLAKVGQPGQNRHPDDV